MKWALLLAIWVALFSAPGLADIDESAYQAGAVLRDEQERQRLKQQIDQDAAIEQRRAEAAAEQEERARIESLADEAARPLGERLTDQHCTLCHSAENYTTKRHSWLVWRLVVARMVWLNDAPLPFEAQGIITDHLARTYRALPEEKLIEFASMIAAGFLLSTAAWAGRRLRKHRRRAAHGEGI